MRRAEGHQSGHEEPIPPDEHDVTDQGTDQTGDYPVPVAGRFFVRPRKTRVIDNEDQMEDGQYFEDGRLDGLRRVIPDRLTEDEVEREIDDEA